MGRRAESAPQPTNPYGVVLDDASLRWAAARRARPSLLETRSMDEVVAKLHQGSLAPA